MGSSAAHIRGSFPAPSPSRSRPRGVVEQDFHASTMPVRDAVMSGVLRPRREERDTGEKVDHFVGAEHRRQGPRLFRYGDHDVERPRSLERDLIGNRRAHTAISRELGADFRSRTKYTWYVRMSLGAQVGGRPTKVTRETDHALDVRALRVWGQNCEPACPRACVAEAGSWALICQAAWSFPGVCSGACRGADQIVGKS